MRPLDTYDAHLKCRHVHGILDLHPTSFWNVTPGLTLHHPHLEKAFKEPVCMQIPSFSNVQLYLQAWTTCRASALR